MVNITHTPVLVVVLLLAAAFVVALLSKHLQIGRYVFLLTSFTVLFLSARLTFIVLEHGTIHYTLGGWVPPFGIEIIVDAFAAFSSLVVAGVSSLIFWFAVYGPAEVKNESGYYSLLLLLTGAMHGMVMTGDLFNLFVFVEISSLAAIAIIAVKGTSESIEASFRYLVLSALGSGGVLFSIALIFMISGHLNMAYIREALVITSGQYPLNVVLAVGFMLVGFAVKAALFPLHVWLPDAHSNAPTASSALLSGLVVKVYIIAFMRIAYLALGIPIFETLPIRQIFLVLASIAIIMGSVFAMVQDNIKRMLAFSTVAQVGYIFLGFGLFNQRALEGAVLHILNHAIMKALLFLSAGVIIHQSGHKKISELSGLGRRIPLTFAAFTIGALSMIGIPGTAGFVSKLYLALGALDSGLTFFAIVILISSLLNAIYYLPIIITAFFGKDSSSDAKDPAWATQLPLVVLSVGVLFFGLFPSIAIPLVRQTAQLFIR